jgi:hypothetical protein
MYAANWEGANLQHSRVSADGGDSKEEMRPCMRELPYSGCAINTGNY